jgi:hypothetical protein
VAVAWSSRLRADWFSCSSAAGCGVRTPIGGIQGDRSVLETTPGHTGAGAEGLAVEPQDNPAHGAAPELGTQTA